jgi:hypothetical protein
MLKLEKAPVGQIAKFSKVRREDVYRVLPTLEKIDLIEKLIGKIAETRATSISDARESLATLFVCLCFVASATLRLKY